MKHLQWNQIVSELYLNRNTKNNLIAFSVVEHFTNAVLDGVIVGTMFGIHREFTINKLVGLRDLDAQQQDGEGEAEGRHVGRRSSIADSLRNKSIECRCFVCHRFDFDFY